MSHETYQDPVAQLLTLGEPNIVRGNEWLEYRICGIGPEHIPALIQLAIDQALLANTDEQDPAGWAPVHAWRALGQLHAQEAIQPLVNLFHEVKDNDWVIEELPDVFAFIGSSAIPDLAAYLRDWSHPDYSRMVAATSLMEIGRLYSENRGDCAQVLIEQLEKFAQNTPGVNGILIANLVELEVFDSSELIHQVYAEGQVDRFITGDWRDIEIRLQNPPPLTDNARTRTGTWRTPQNPTPTETKTYSEPKTRPLASTEKKTHPLNPHV